MRTVSILLLLSLTACGTCRTTCDFYVDNVCIVSNGLDIDPELVALTFREVEARFEPRTVVADAALELELSVSFVTNADTQGEYSNRLDWTEGMGGECITVQWTPSCRFLYGALGHETIHYLFDYHDIDDDHNTPGVWMDGPNRREDSIEFEIFDSMHEHCQAVGK